MAEKITDIVDKSAFEQLDKLVTSLTNVKVTYDDIVATMMKTSSTAARTSKESIEQQKKLEQLERERLKTSQEQEKLQQQINRTLASKLKLEKDEAKAIAESTSEYKKLVQQYKEAAQKAKELGAEHGETSKQFKKAAKEASELNDKLKAIDSGIGNYQRNVGNYASAFNKIGAAVKSTLAPLLAITTAVSAFKGIIESTDDSSDKWNATIAGLKGGLSYLARTIADWDWSNFTKGLGNAITAAAEFEDTMDRIQERQGRWSVEEAKVNQQIKEQMLIFKDHRKSEEERIAAEQKMTELNAQLVAKQLKIAEDAFYSLATTVERSQNYKIDYKAIMALTTSYDEFAAKLGNANPVLKRYNNLNEDTRGKLQDAAKAVMQAKTAQDEFRLGLLRTEMQIEKSADKEQKASDKSAKAAQEAAWKKMQAREELADFEMKRIENEAKADEKRRKEKEQNDQLELTEEQAVAARRAEIWQTAAANMISNEELLNEYRRATLLDTTNTVAQLADVFQQYYDDDLRAIETKKDKELKAAGNNKAKQKEIEEKYAAEEEKLRKKSAAARTVQAVADRINAAAHVIFSTNEAVAKAIAAFPLTAGQPWVSIIYALMAGQLGAIAAAPLPKYAKGRKGGPAEFALVGEAGAEVINMPGRGGAALVDKPTLTFLPAGADVISNKDLMRMAFKNYPTTRDGQMGFDIAEIIDSTSQRTAREIVKAIKEKEELHINITEAGLQAVARRAQGWTDYVNKNVRV